MEGNPYLHTFFLLLILQLLYAFMRAGIEYGAEHSVSSVSTVGKLRPPTRPGQVISMDELQIGATYRRGRDRSLGEKVAVLSMPYRYQGLNWVVDIKNNYGKGVGLLFLGDCGVVPYKNGWNQSNSLHRTPS